MSSSQFFTLNHDEAYEAQFTYAWFRQIKDAGKWRRLKLSSSRNLAIKEPQIAAFESIQKYMSPNEKLSELFMMDFAFDFDCEDDINKAKEDTKKLINFLALYLKKEEIRIYFSGSKGFGVVVDRRIIGAVPSTDTHFYLKVIANELVRDLRLETLDPRIYISKRLLRILHTQHEKTKLYKIELDPSELELSIEEIKELAKKPRNFEFYEGVIPKLNPDFILN